MRLEWMLAALGWDLLAQHVACAGVRGGSRQPGSLAKHTGHEGRRELHPHDTTS